MSRKLLNKVKTGEAGVTLVELLAAIAILSIVVTAFLAFFIQAAETNNRTNELNEATFLAQEEMELVTSYSTAGYSGQEVKEKFSSEGTYPKDSQGYFIEATLTEPKPEDDTQLYKVVVTVSKGGKSRAEMETRLPFETESE